MKLIKALSVFAVIILFSSILVTSDSTAEGASVVSKANIAPEVSQDIDSQGKSEVIVKLKSFNDNVSTNSDKQVLNYVQEDLIDDLKIEKLEVEKIDNFPGIVTSVDSDLLNELENDSRVESVTKNRYYSLNDFRLTSGSFVSLNDAVGLLAADDVWSAPSELEGSGEKIAIVDTGVQSNHPFLNGQVVGEACFVYGQDGANGTGDYCPNGLVQDLTPGSGAPCETSAQCDHGTHVAGIAAGKQGVGGSAPIAGIAPSAEILAIRVFGLYQGELACGHSGSCLTANGSSLISAFNWIQTFHSDTASMNLSLGGGQYSSACDDPDDSVDQAINSIHDQGISVIAATGNNGQGSTGSTSYINWPACLAKVVAVGSSSKSDGISSFGDSNSLVDLWAPGQGIISSVTGSNYGMKNGTSMSTPMVSAAFAILNEAYPGETHNQLLTRLQTSGVELKDSRNNVTRTRPDLVEAIELSTPTIPDSPESAQLVANSGTGTVSWNPIFGAKSYRITNSNGSLLKTVSNSSSSTSVTTQFGVSNRFGVRAVTTMGQSTVEFTNTVIGKAGSAQNGYAFFASNGAVVGKGVFLNYTRGPRSGLNRPVVGGATSSKFNGGWSVAGDGGIFTFGNANFYGSTGNINLNKPIVGMASTPSGKGYWLVASDGGIFTFGDANFYGSTGNINLNKPIVGMASTKNGKGYWLVASDGGIFTFGNANFYGSTGSMSLNKPVVGMKPTVAGNGYWLFASDGGVFSFGNTQFYGSGVGLGHFYPRAG